MGSQWFFKKILLIMDHFNLCERRFLFVLSKLFYLLHGIYTGQFRALSAVFAGLVDTFTAGLDVPFWCSHSFYTTANF